MNDSSPAQSETALTGASLRHRDLLLSLKYSTVEACFSVPMLNLTMPNLPFVIAFVVTALGWKPWAIGLMAALPHLCNFIQPPLTGLLHRRSTLYRVMCLGFALSALPWALAGFLPWITTGRSLVFAGLVTVATLANSITSVAWSASIAEVVPSRISGKYYARRNLFFGFWTLVVVMIAGGVVDLGQSPLLAFAWVFTAAGVARWMGLFFLTRMKFPATVTTQQSRSVDWNNFRDVFRDANYLRFVGFIGLWGLFLNMGMPFFTVYLLDQLHFTMTTIIKLITVSSLGGLVALKAWGTLCDRFGSKPVMQVCALLWAIIGLVSWLVVGPHLTFHLYFYFLAAGAATAGFQLCQFNLMVGLIPVGRRSPHIAVFLALTSLLTAVGPALGGLALSQLPEDALGTVFHHVISRYHVLFAVSFLGCLLSVRLLSRVREATAQPVEQVWRTMRTMRVFNPLLGMTTMAEFVFTPRGLIGLTRQSVRSLRKQVRVISDVGEEIVEGSQEIVRSSINRRKRD